MTDRERLYFRLWSQRAFALLFDLTTFVGIVAWALRGYSWGLLVAGFSLGFAIHATILMWDAARLVTYR
jgi:hypothetical protein